MTKYLKEVTKFIINIKRQYALAFLEMQEELENLLGEERALDIMEKIHNEDLTEQDALILVEEALE